MTIVSHQSTLWFFQYLLSKITRLTLTHTSIQTYRQDIFQFSAWDGKDFYEPFFLGKEEFPETHSGESSNKAFQGGGFLTLFQPRCPRGDLRQRGKWASWMLVLHPNPVSPAGPIFCLNRFSNNTILLGRRVLQLKLSLKAIVLWFYMCIWRKRKK